MDECGEKNTISLSWGRREIRISGEGATLYVNGVPHDMTMMLETIRGAGARPERISPARWISLLRGRPTVLPGCESPLVMVRAVSYTHLDVYKRQAYGRPEKSGYLPADQAA